MKFAVSKGETEISELTTRIFEIKGRGAAATSQQVEAALLKANPHLSDLTKVKPGTLIVIPDLADIPSPRGPQTTGASNDAMDQLKFTMENLLGAIERSAKSEEAALAEQNAALKDSELKRLVEQSPEAKEQLSKLTEALKNRAKELKAESSARKEGVKPLLEALDKLPV